MPNRKPKQPRTLYLAMWAIGRVKMVNNEGLVQIWTTADGGKNLANICKPVFLVSLIRKEGREERSPVCFRSSSSSKNKHAG